MTAAALLLFALSVALLVWVYLLNTHYEREWLRRRADNEEWWARQAAEMRALIDLIGVNRKDGDK